MFTFPNPGTTATMEPPTVGMNGRTRLPEFGNGLTAPTSFVGQVPMTGVPFAHQSAFPVGFSPMTGVIPQAPVYGNPYNLNTVQPWINTTPCTPWAGVPSFCPIPAMQGVSPFGMPTIPTNYNYALPVTPSVPGIMTGNTVGAIPHPAVTNINPMTSVPTPFMNSPFLNTPFVNPAINFGLNPWINNIPSPMLGNGISNLTNIAPFGHASLYGQNPIVGGIGLTNPGLVNPGLVNPMIGQFPGVSPFTGGSIFGSVPASPFVQGGLSSLTNPFISGVQNVPCHPFLGLGDPLAGIGSPYCGLNTPFVGGINPYISANPFSGTSPLGLSNPYSCVGGVCSPFNGTLSNNGVNPWASHPFAGYGSNISGAGFNNPWNCSPFAIPSQGCVNPQLANSGLCPIW